MTEIDLFAYAERRSQPQTYPAGVPHDVCDLFERLALHIRDERGLKRYSADAILHRIRWHYEIERRYHNSFKANNNWTATLARWFLRRHPEKPKFFELRERKVE